MVDALGATRSLLHILSIGPISRLMSWHILPDESARSDVHMAASWPPPSSRAKLCLRPHTAAGLSRLDCADMGVTFADRIVALVGWYNVAATVPHFSITRWFLEIGMRQSVKFHARGLVAPELNDRSLFKRGLRHFETGCESCHGFVQSSYRQFGNRILPAAPPLQPKIPDWTPEQLFWIVKHWLKMTGMPAWEAQTRDDEVWAVVAFLTKLPDLTLQEYTALVHRERNPAAAPDDGSLIVMAGPFGESEAACVRCHGLGGRGSSSGGFPRLNQQNATYLYRSSQRYRTGERPSGIMAPIARTLSDEDMRKVAQYYSAVRIAPAGTSKPAPKGQVEALQLGGALAAVGAPKTQPTRLISLASICRFSGWAARVVPSEARGRTEALVQVTKANARVKPRQAGKVIKCSFRAPGKAWVKAWIRLDK
jgi:cytochrome c553